MQVRARRCPKREGQAFLIYIDLCGVPGAVLITLIFQEEGVDCEGEVFDVFIPQQFFEILGIDKEANPAAIGREFFAFVLGLLVIVKLPGVGFVADVKDDGGAKELLGDGAVYPNSEAIRITADFDLGDLSRSDFCSRRRIGDEVAAAIDQESVGGVPLVSLGIAGGFFPDGDEGWVGLGVAVGGSGGVGVGVLVAVGLAVGLGLEC